MFEARFGLFHWNERDIYADNATWCVFVLIFTNGNFFAVKNRLRFLWPGKLLVYIHSSISFIDFKPDCLVSVVITWLSNPSHAKSNLWSVNLKKQFQYNIKYGTNKFAKIHVELNSLWFLQRFIVFMVYYIVVNNENIS